MQCACGTLQYAGLKMNINDKYKFVFKQFGLCIKILKPYLTLFAPDTISTSS